MYGQTISRHFCMSDFLLGLLISLPGHKCCPLIWQSNSVCDVNIFRCFYANTWKLLYCSGTGLFSSSCNVKSLKT
jgi:hypothetical protein